MTYVTGTVTPVPEDRRDDYIACSAKIWAIMREYGALETYECFEDNCPEGEQTSFPRAVQRQPGEVVVLNWIVWPDKAACDACMASFETDDRWKVMSQVPMDGARMIFGGFVPVFHGTAAS